MEHQKNPCNKFILFDEYLGLDFLLAFYDTNLTYILWLWILIIGGYGIRYPQLHGMQVSDQVEDEIKDLPGVEPNTILML